MREGIKMTARYEILYMLFVQLLATAISFVFITVAFWWFVDKPVWKEILSFVFILVNGGFIYTYAHRFAVQDNKPYTPMKSSMLKGVMMGLVISAVNILLFLLFTLVWALWGEGSHLTNWFAISINTLFSLWTFPYMGIMGMSCGNITWYSVIILALMPPAASSLGYYAGSKKFFLLEAIDKFSYEKNDTKK